MMGVWELSQLAMHQGNVWQYDGCMRVVPVGYESRKCLAEWWVYESCPSWLWIKEMSGSMMGVWQFSQLAMYTRSVWQQDGCMTVVQVGCVCKKCLKHGSMMGVWQLSQMAMYTRSVWHMMGVWQLSQLDVNQGCVWQTAVWWVYASWPSLLCMQGVSGRRQYDGCMTVAPVGYVYKKCLAVWRVYDSWPSWLCIQEVSGSMTGVWQLTQLAMYTRNVWQYDGCMTVAPVGYACKKCLAVWWVYGSCPSWLCMQEVWNTAVWWVYGSCPSWLCIQEVSGSMMGVWQLAMHARSVWQYDGCMRVDPVCYVCKKCLADGSMMGVWELTQLAMYTRRVWNTAGWWVIPWQVSI